MVYVFLGLLITTSAEDAINKFEDVLNKAQTAFNVVPSEFKLVAMGYMIASRIIITEFKMKEASKDEDEDLRLRIRNDAKKFCLNVYINNFQGVPEFTDQVKKLFSSSFFWRRLTNLVAKKKVFKMLRTGADNWFTAYSYFNEKRSFTKVGPVEVDFLTDLAIFRTPIVVGSKKLSKEVDNFIAFTTSAKYLFALPINSLNVNANITKSNVLVIKKSQFDDDFNQPLLEDDTCQKTFDSETFTYLDLKGKQIQCIAVSGNMLFCGARNGNIIVVNTETLEVLGELHCNNAISLCVSNKFVFAAADNFLHFFSLRHILEKLEKNYGEPVQRIMWFEYESPKRLVLQVACVADTYLSVLIGASTLEDGSSAEDGKLELWSTKEHPAGMHTRRVVLYDNISYEKVVVYDPDTAEPFEDIEDFDEEENEEEEEIKEGLDFGKKPKKKVFVPHKMVFDKDNLIIYGLTQGSCLTEPKSAVDTWNYKCVDEAHPLPYTSAEKGFHIIDFCAASVAAAIFPGRPFLFFVGKDLKKLKMYSLAMKDNIYQDSPDLFLRQDNNDTVYIAMEPEKTSKKVSQIVSLWVDEFSLYVVCKDQSDDSYLVKF